MFTFLYIMARNYYIYYERNYERDKYDIIYNIDYVKLNIIQGTYEYIQYSLYLTKDRRKY